MTARYLKIFSIKLPLALIVFLSLLNETYAQQFSLYNSRTLYDSFENPSQRAYQVDTSKRFAFNFFIPVISINGNFSGPAESSFKSLLYDGVFNGRDLTIGQNRLNIVSLNSNNYIAMFRILKKVKQYQEMGVSWQIRNDGRAQVTNEVFAIFDNYERFDQNNLKNIFNVKGYNQAYHQFSFTYRKNYTKRFALGVKLSLLSGIAYSSIKVNKSELTIDKVAETFDLSVSGRVRSSFEFDNFKKEMIKPFFKNPGLSFTLGSSYRLRDGWTVLGNLKDIGFIKWNQALEYNFNTGNITIDNANDNDADNKLADELEDRIYTIPINKSYLSAINGKVEAMLSKEFGDYKPNLILSKSIYYGGGNIALINNYHFKNYVFTASTDYNTNGFLQVGGQFMIKTPNVEFYMGSDQLLSSYRMLREYKSSAAPYPSNYTGTSFYMGFGLKFGKILEHQANANLIPGLKKKKTGGFIKKLIGKKEE